MATAEPVRIGDAVLYLGDCLDILPTLAAGSVDAVVTDPPYAFTGGISNGRASESTDQFFLHWWKDVCSKLVPLLRDDGEGFLWCDWRSATTFAAGFQIDQKYTWRLASMLYHYREMPGNGNPFRSSVDTIAYLRGPKSDGHRIANTTHNWISKYWYYGKHANHPSEKDPEICGQLVKWCSDEGMTVIDPFMGSGPAGIAASTLRRKFIGIEGEERYFAIACKRIEAAQAQLRMDI